MFKLRMVKICGYTMIELVVVIVILGILSAVSIPRYINARDAGQKTAIKSLAAALGVASASNYGLRKSNPQKGIAITNCQDVSSLLPGGSSSINGYTIDSLAISSDVEVQCTIRITYNGKLYTDNFIAQGIS